MARSTYSTVIILSVFISLLFGIALAYYCEWNLCGQDEYCCGDNYCCNSVYSLWYFWAGIIILALMLWSCGGGLLRYCFAIRTQVVVKPVANYVPLPSEPSAPDESQTFHPCEDIEHHHEENVAPLIQHDAYGRIDHSINFPPDRGPPPPYSKEPDSTASSKMDTSWS